MNLKCRIKDKDFDLVQGVTFAEEYSETLDSGSIIISGVEKIYDLKPYDDVFIWNADEEFNGYDLKNKTSNKERPTFYKHMLVDQFTEEVIFFGFPDKNDNTKYIGTKYKYKIQLFSETKRLETIQLPNISITQPLRISNKKSVYEYLLMFNDMYSLNVKVVDNKDEKTWKYVKKYTIDPSLSEDFGNVYAPDFTLNNPNYRDLLSKLMLVKDCIPYVEDDVIKKMDITLRKGPFEINRNYIHTVIGSRSSDNFCDNLKRTYSEALSQDNSCRFVEYLGFRNSNAALMTLGNMQIETRYPIYKINKIYMCYYKKGYHHLGDLNRAIKEGKLYHIGQIVFYENKHYECIKEHNSPYISPNKDDPGYWYWHDFGKETEYSFGNFFKEYNQYKIFLCKQDITPLVKLESERNLLSQDWSKFKFVGNIDGLSKYKFGTVGYNIGSNVISGWGTKYTYPQGWWDVNKTYIQNIIKIVDSVYPYGINDASYFLSNSNEVIDYAHGERFDTFDFMDDGIITPFTYDWDGLAGFVQDAIPENYRDATKLKSFFFEIDYNGFYSGTVIHSKDVNDDDITMNDNSSESLTLLEQDGLYQKEKINRFGNKALQIFGRYTHSSQMQPLGSVYNYDGEDDVVIYRKEYSIFDKEISCSYYGAKDYVLKNYFTTVFARHRTYNLMSYGESTRRSENKKMFLLISKDKSYFENENQKLGFNDFEGNYLDKILSFYKNSIKVKNKDNFIFKDKINYGVIQHNDNYYASDINAFISGYSLCFNLVMFDNVSGGVYISKANPFADRTSDWEVLFENKDDYTGSLQDWYMMVDDEETGFTKEIGFYVFHVNDINYGNLESSSIDYTDENKQKIYDIYENKLLKLPYLNELEKDISNKIGMQYEINKDNKELIDMTFQIEPTTDTQDIMFSQWLMKLSDLNGVYNKVQEEYVSDNFYVAGENIAFRISTFAKPAYNINGAAEGFQSFSCNPLIILQIGKEIFEKGEVPNLSTLYGEFKWENVIKTLENDTFLTEDKCTKYSLKFKQIQSISETEIKLICDEYVEIYDYAMENKIFEGTNENKIILLKRRTKETVSKTEESKQYYSSNPDSLEFVNYNQWGDVGNGEDLFALLEENRIKYEHNGEIKTLLTGVNDEGITYPGTTHMPSGFIVSNMKNFIPVDPKCYNFTYPTWDKKLVISDTTSQLWNVLTNKPFVEYLREPNIFIKLSPQKMKKTIVYNELEELVAGTGETIDSKVENYISIVDNKMIISGLAYNTQSVQVWYFDEKSQSYYFVFGVNKEPGTYSMELYISMLSTKNTRVYDENYKVVGHITNKGDGKQHYE